MNKAVFVDKDGTLIVDIPYNVDPTRVLFQAGAIEALKKLRTLGYMLIMISNQSGIAHGYFNEDDLLNLKTDLQRMLGSHGVALDAIYFCPHHPNGKVTRYAVECECRKPNAGMLLQAAKDFEIDLTRSWMIGDILNDVEAGNRAGCKTILIENGNETEWSYSVKRRPTVIVKSLAQAAESIIHQHELA